MLTLQIYLMLVILKLSAILSDVNNIVIICNIIPYFGARVGQVGQVKGAEVKNCLTQSMQHKLGSVLLTPAILCSIPVGVIVQAPLLLNPI